MSSCRLPTAILDRPLDTTARGNGGRDEEMDLTVEQRDGDCSIAIKPRSHITHAEQRGWPKKSANPRQQTRTGRSSASRHANVMHRDHRIQKTGARRTH